MIGRAVDPEGDPVYLSNDSAHIGVKARLKAWWNQWTAVFRAENEMNDQVCRGVTQALSPLTGLASPMPPHPWLTPWALFRAF